MPIDADSVHLVVFGSMTVFDLPALFRDLYGVAPTNLQPHQSGVGSQASAQSGSLLATVVAQPGRIELIAGPVLSRGPGLPSVNLDAGIAMVRSKANALIERFELTRLALVANTFQNVGTSAAACEAFVAATGIPVPGDTTDLAFVMNRRKTMEGSDIVVNRLLRTDAALRQMVQFSTQHPVPISIDYHVLTMQADINSTQRIAPIANASALALVDFLVSELNQCLSGGYEYIIENS